MQEPPPGDSYPSDLEGDHLKLFAFLCSRANRKGVAVATNEQIAIGVFGSVKTSDRKVRAYMADLHQTGHVPERLGEGIYQLDVGRVRQYYTDVIISGQNSFGAVEGVERAEGPDRLKEPERQAEGDCPVAAGGFLPEPLDVRRFRRNRVRVPGIMEKSALGSVYPQRGTRTVRLVMDTREGTRPVTNYDLAWYKFPDVLDTMGITRHQNSPAALQKVLCRWNGLAPTYVLRMMVEFADHADWCRKSADPAWLVFVKRKTVLVKLVDEKDFRDHQHAEQERYRNDPEGWTQWTPTGRP